MSIQGTFLQNNTAIQLVVWEKILKGFFTLIAMATGILHTTQLFEGI